MNSMSKNKSQAVPGFFLKILERDIFDQCFEFAQHERCFVYVFSIVKRLLQNSCSEHGRGINVLDTQVNKNNT